MGTKLNIQYYFLPLMILIVSNTGAALIHSKVQSKKFSEYEKIPKTILGSISFLVITVCILCIGLLAI